MLKENARMSEAITTTSTEPMKGREARPAMYTMMSATKPATMTPRFWVPASASSSKAATV